MIEVMIIEDDGIIRGLIKKMIEKMMVSGLYARLPRRGKQLRVHTGASPKRFRE